MIIRVASQKIEEMVVVLSRESQYFPYLFVTKSPATLTVFYPMTNLLSYGRSVGRWRKKPPTVNAAHFAVRHTGDRSTYTKVYTDNTTVATRISPAGDRFMIASSHTQK